MTPPPDRPDCCTLRMCLVMALMALILMQSQTLATAAPQPPPAALAR